MKRFFPFHRFVFSDLLKDSSLCETFFQSLKQGAVAVIPTDTLYGFAVDGDSESGVRLLYRIKGRTENKPLILFLYSVESFPDLGISLSEQTKKFLLSHWPGPLTAVFPFSGNRLRAFQHPTMGIRIPDHKNLLNLLSRYTGFLLTTSVNRSGQSPLFDPDRIEEEFGGEIHWLLDAGIIPLSEPSTVVDMMYWPPKILRPGKIRL